MHHKYILEDLNKCKPKHYYFLLRGSITCFRGCKCWHTKVAWRPQSLLLGLSGGWCVQFKNSTQHSIRNIPLLLRGSHFFMVAIPKGILIQHQYNKDDIDHKWYNWAFSYRRNTRPTQGWAGIPVPGHSQEWRPLIPFPELWEWIFSFPSRSRILGMDFFHSLPVPEFWEWIFFIPFPFPNFGNGFFPFPSRSRIMGMVFFHSHLVPELWEWIFSFPSRSRIVGMDFFHSLPVPEFWE